MTDPAIDPWAIAAKFSRELDFEWSRSQTGRRLIRWLGDRKGGARGTFLVHVRRGAVVVETKSEPAANWYRTVAPSRGWPPIDRLVGEP